GAVGVVASVDALRGVAEGDALDVVVSGIAHLQDRRRAVAVEDDLAVSGRTDDDGAVGGGGLREGVAAGVGAGVDEDHVAGLSGGVGCGEAGVVVGFLRAVPSGSVDVSVD